MVTQQLADKFTMSKLTSRNKQTIDYETSLTRILFVAFNYSAPNEIRFVAAGSDWPSVTELEAEVIIVNEPKFRINPIRRARQWIERKRS